MVGASDGRERRIAREEHGADGQHRSPEHLARARAREHRLNADVLAAAAAAAAAA
jgi:hypothetical protein